MCYECEGTGNAVEDIGIGPEEEYRECACEHCQGTGKVTRAATWEDVIKIINSLLRDNISPVVFTFDTNYTKKYLKLPSGGILRVKGEE